MLEKMCSKCKKVKPLSEFSPNKEGLYGKKSQCKECGGAYMKQRRSDPSTKAIELQRRRIYAAKNRLSQKGIAREFFYRQSGKIRLWQRKWRLANKEKRQAYIVMQIAIKNGTLANIKTLKCSYPNCDSPAAHYHHHKGYDDAHKLDVVPLCVIHHGLTRRKY